MTVDSCQLTETQQLKMKVLGIDIGASGVKGAIVDTETGEMISERLRLVTPQPATPDAVAKTVKELAKQIGWKDGLIGVGFPAIVRKGVAQSAANIDKSWIGTSISEALSKATKCPVVAVNDADAAGIAAVKFGAGKGKKGVIILLTLGSGIGSALFLNGELVPNTELGHFQLEGMIAEHYASNNARKKFDLSWEEWGKRLNKYLKIVNRLFSPDLILLGGGVSKKFEKYGKYLTGKMNVKAAELKNDAGIILSLIHI